MTSLRIYSGKSGAMTNVQNYLISHKLNDSLNHDTEAIEKDD
jgi:hypothetical protein